MSKDEGSEPVAVRTRTPEKVVVQPLVAEETKDGLKPVENKEEAPESREAAQAAEETPSPEKAAEKPDIPTDGPSKDEPAKDTPGPDGVTENATAAPPDGTPPLDGSGGPESKEVAELEAAAKQMEAIDKLTEAREYFLPINTVEKRRSKIITLLGLLLIVVLGLLLVNLLLDVGVIHIEGVRPVTRFFSS